MDDSVAVFVSPAGSDTGGAGTKSNPVASITRAQEKGPLKPRIYVCVGAPYKEHVKLQRAQSIYGGFDCGTWQAATGTETTRVEPDDPGYALEIPGIPNDVTVGGDAFTIADIAFTAKDAANDGASSIAGSIRQSKGVRLRRVTLTAGNGKDAKLTGAREPYADRGDNGINGQDGGAAVTNDCPVPLESSTGGAGGQGSATQKADGGAGQPILPPHPNAGANGVGGDSNQDSCLGPAHPGANGEGGEPGTGAPVPGHVTANGWTPEVGAVGGNGKTAQGGGGGAGYTQPGGGGGSGGCGGMGGLGGASGGSSIALLVFDTPIALTGCTLKRRGWEGRWQRGRGPSRPTWVQHSGNWLRK
ncbi:hypothetical protein LZC95_20080 [Pendulispora brunnea]|uniref:Uncharacterized protein n=1 Tax=Pendulispora brunnea TaxID=2905690 RepID=A0ABZ2KS20_9BACT